MTNTRDVPVYVDRLVPLPDELTRECECNTREPVTWLDAAVIAIEYRQCYESCAVRMDEIRRVMDE